MKEVLIERNEKLLRIAIIKDKKLVECLIEEEGGEPQPGEIYKGIVKNIVPAIKCAFVDIGYEKSCYMYLDRKFNNTNIKKNDEIVVEILKEGTGEKGPKVTNAITIPGRYAVLETLNKKVAFSKKIENSNFKDSIKQNIKKPDEIGIMIRTNSETASIDSINREIDKLYKIYCDIAKSAEYSMKPKLLYSGEGILDKILRDCIDEDIEKLVVNNKRDYDYLKSYLELDPELHCKLELYSESISLFNYYGVEGHILNLRNNKVMLKSGGHIVIDKTEAMHVIDVNSGKNVKNSSLDKTVLNTNMEAAKEIGRQIRLRNLSGIIIIDFIDMDNAVYKDMVLEELKTAFEGDKNKTVIYPFTQLNIVQVARRRRGKPINDYIEEDCNCCKGRGRRIRLSYLESLIRSEILKIDYEFKMENIYIELGSTYKDDVLKDIDAFAEKISCIDKKIYVNFVEYMDYFKIEPLIFQNRIENMQKFKIYG